MSYQDEAYQSLQDPEEKKSIIDLDDPAIETRDVTPTIERGHANVASTSSSSHDDRLETYHFRPMSGEKVESRWDFHDNRPSESPTNIFGVQQEYEHSSVVLTQKRVVLHSASLTGPAKGKKHSSITKTHQLSTMSVPLLRVKEIQVARNTCTIPKSIIIPIVIFILSLVSLVGFQSNLWIIGTIFHRGSSGYVTQHMLWLFLMDGLLIYAIVYLLKRLTYAGKGRVIGVIVLYAIQLIVFNFIIFTTYVLLYFEIPSGISVPLTFFLNLSLAFNTIAVALWYRISIVKTEIRIASDAHFYPIVCRVEDSQIGNEIVNAVQELAFHQY